MGFNYLTVYIQCFVCFNCILCFRFSCEYGFVFFPVEHLLSFSFCDFTSLTYDINIEFRLFRFKCHSYTALNYETELQKFFNSNKTKSAHVNSAT